MTEFHCEKLPAIGLCDGSEKWLYNQSLNKINYEKAKKPLSILNLRKFISLLLNLPG